MYYRGREDFRTRFQSVVLTADKVLKLKTSRFILSTGISSQGTVGAKTTVCVPELVRSFGLYKFCLEAYLVLYP